MKTLKLFNAVVAKPTTDVKPHISPDGYVIEPDAMWAKDRIVAYYTSELLGGNDLNKTFHKSWHYIQESPRYKLLFDQIRHYMSTYGSNFEDEVYIPNEVLNIPEVDKLTYKVIKAYTKEEMTDKCLKMLQSGIALNEETINDLLTVLVDELKYEFTGKEGIRNKEAIIKIADLYMVYPTDTIEFFRYIIYKATGGTLLIKNKETIQAIKNSSFNPSVQFREFGVTELAEIFNRFKPLFLAFKNRCPATINLISKLSKTHHKPMVSNPLNFVTSIELNFNDTHWLDNATPFALFKALSACYMRLGGENAYTYRIRNGKSWTTSKVPNSYISNTNYHLILHYLKNRFDFKDMVIYEPPNVIYALPTSEKMYVGNIPTGTTVYGKKLAVGMYWEDDWGAIDLDLSGLNLKGKIGWNAYYTSDGRELTYSGDLTSAPRGAVEYLYAAHNLGFPTLVNINVYSGSHDCGYKIIVGHGDDVTRQYMMNPNNLLFEVKTQAVQNQMILGMFIPNGEMQSFVLLNFGSGSHNVSGRTELSKLTTQALVNQWKKPMYLSELLWQLGATSTDTKEDATLDLSLDKLEKDTFTKIFE